MTVVWCGVVQCNKGSALEAARRAAPREPAAGEGRVSRYAWGPTDYHDVIRDRLGGLADFLELLEAETIKVEADRLQIVAIYVHHDSIANLEAVVGTSIRTP